MPGVTALKMSSRVSQAAMSLTLERRRDRSSNYSSVRRPRRNRSFRNRSVRVALETSRERDDVKSGQKSAVSSSSSSASVSSMNLSENFMPSMQSHGEKVRCLIKMIDQQRQLFEQVQRFPIMQLQARRLRSLFALAQHFDSKSTPAAAGATTGTKLSASEEYLSRKGPEQGVNIQLGAEFSKMSLSS